MKYSTLDTIAFFAVPLIIGMAMRFLVDWTFAEVWLFSTVVGLLFLFLRWTQRKAFLEEIAQNRQDVKEQ